MESRSNIVPQPTFCCIHYLKVHHQDLKLKCQSTLHRCSGGMGLRPQLMGELHLQALLGELLLQALLRERRALHLRALDLRVVMLLLLRINGLLALLELRGLLRLSVGTSGQDAALRIKVCHCLSHQWVKDTTVQKVAKGFEMHG